MTVSELGLKFEKNKIIDTKNTKIWDVTKGEQRSYFDAEPIARLLLHEKKPRHLRKELQRTNEVN